MRRLCAAVFAASLASLVIAGDSTDTRIRRVTQEIPPLVLVRGEPPVVTSLAARMAELRVPAVSIAVIHKGRIEWARGFGVTRWDGPSVTERTLFQAASISKPIFALGVLTRQGGTKAFVSAPMARAMLTPVLEGHGLGPRIGGATSRKFFTHNGGNEGYRCLLVAYEDGEGAVVMTNSDNGGAIMDEVVRSIAAAYVWPDFAPAIHSRVDLKPEWLARWIGVYEFNDGSIYIVRKRAGRLQGQKLGHAPMELFASSDHELFARVVDLAVGFEEAGGTTTMCRRLGETERCAVRAAEAKARKVLSWLDSTEQRFREQTADPASETTIRTLLAGITAGEPDYRGMSPALADSMGQQLPAMRQWFEWLGALKSLKFVGVDTNGRDEYRGDFVQGRLRSVIQLDEDGRIDSAEFSPG